MPNKLIKTMKLFLHQQKMAWSEKKIPEKTELR